jgi:hypothetical protein
VSTQATGARTGQTKKGTVMSRTNHLPAALVLALAATLLLGLSAKPAQPAETPPAKPQIPVGHPGIDKPNPTESMVPADAADVESVDAIIDAYYASISGPKGEARDWERFISLFMPDARFIAARQVEGQMVPFPMSVQSFVDSNRAYFEKGGYFETDIHRQTDAFGSIAQVFSSYASRRALEDAEPYARGINSFQVMKASGRWWIVSMVWDSEKPSTGLIPVNYLPEAAGGD